MNFKLVLICLGAMLMINESEAFFHFNRFGRFGAFGLGFPYGGLGFGYPGFGLGYPGFGFGGLGFGGFGFGGGFGRFGGGFGGGFGRGGRHGREINANMTQCSITTESKKLICTGLNELTCDVAQNFTGLATPFQYMLSDLTIEMVGEDYHLFGTKETTEHKITTEEHTFIDPVSNKPVTIALFFTEGSAELGFKFVDEKCWAKFDSLVKSIVKPEEIEFEVSMSSV